jgi:hypothetical protein
MENGETSCVIIKITKVTTVQVRDSGSMLGHTRAMLLFSIAVPLH